jgi:hypothetical protein
MSIGILVAVIIVGVVARKNLYIYSKADVVMASTHISNTRDDKFGGGTYKLDSYLIYLQDYLSTSEVKLSIDDETKKEDLLQELKTIANLEKENSIKHMSIDGREIAISLLKNIYDVYGINISFSLDGEIQNVNDPFGNPIYQNDEKMLKMEFQVIHLAVVLCINLILFGLSILISRKAKCQ